MHITLKPGTFGIEVTIVKPAKPGDFVQIKSPEEVKEFVEQIREEMEKAREEEAKKKMEQAQAGEKAAA